MFFLNDLSVTRAEYLIVCVASIRWSCFFRKKCVTQVRIILDLYSMFCCLYVEACHLYLTTSDYLRSEVYMFCEGCIKDICLESLLSEVVL